MSTQVINEINDGLYCIYYQQLLDNEITSVDEYYTLIVNDTIKYFSKLEEYEKCLKLSKL